MKKYNISFEKALWKLKAKRRQGNSYFFIIKIVHPNVGFVR